MQMMEASDLHNESEVSTDDDVISIDFVADLIQKKFETFSQQGSLLYEADINEEDHYLDARRLIIEGFEREVDRYSSFREHVRLLENPVNNEDGTLYYGPHLLAIDIKPTCSKFEENDASPSVFKNNKLTSSEEFSVDMTYPLELMKSNRYDVKVFQSILNDYFKSDDFDSKNRKLNIESILFDQHKVIINITNNYLDITRMYLEQKFRKTKRIFHSYVNKLLDEKWHFMYTEMEFTSSIDKTFSESVEKLKKQVQKKINLEKCNVREIFYKTVVSHSQSLEKYFNFIQFLYSLTTLLENKIEIVNNFIKNSMDHSISALQKDIKNFIRKRVILPNHDITFGNLKIGSPIYNEALLINSNFNDKQEILLNFENFPAKAAEIKINNAKKHKSKEVKRIFEEVRNDQNEDSHEDSDAELNFIKKQLNILKELEKIDPTPITTKSVSKSTFDRRSMKNLGSDRASSPYFENLKTFSKSKTPYQSTPSFLANRKIVKAKRTKPMTKLKIMDSLETIKESKVPESGYLTNTNDSTSSKQISSHILNTDSTMTSTLDSNQRCTSQSAMSSLSGSIDDSDGPPSTMISTAFKSPKVPQDSYLRIDDEQPPTVISKSPVLKSQSEVDPCSPGLRYNVKSSQKERVKSSHYDQKYKRNPATEAISRVDLQMYDQIHDEILLHAETQVDNEVQLYDHELFLVSQIKDNVTRGIIVKSIEDKMTDLKKSMMKAFREMTIAQHEYQKLVKYKEELDKNQ